MFNTPAQTIPRNERRIVKDSCTSTGGSPRNVAKKDGKAEHFFYRAPDGFFTENYLGDAGNVEKCNGEIFFLRCPGFRR